MDEVVLETALSVLARVTGSEDKEYLRGITPEEKSAILKANDTDPSGSWCHVIGRRSITEYQIARLVLADLLTERSQAEALAEKEARRLKAEVVSDLTPVENLLQKIHFAKDKGPVVTSGPVPTALALASVRPYLLDFLYQIGEHAKRKVDLTPKGGYLEFLGEPYIKFSLDPLRGGGFWLPGNAVPIIGSNAIMAYVLFFWGMEKIRIIKLPNGNEKIETDPYTLRKATRDILLWCTEMQKGTSLPERNRNEELNEIAGLTNEVLFSESPKPITTRSMAVLRKRIKMGIRSRYELTEETLREVYPQLFSAGKFFRLLRYWESRSNLPFTVKVTEWANKTYNVRIEPV